jgi:hypothetical protein
MADEPLYYLNNSPSATEAVIAIAFRLTVALVWQARVAAFELKPG